MKKIKIAVLLLVIILIGSAVVILVINKNNVAKQKFVTLQGVAQESVAGLVVQGALLEGLPMAEVEKYKGKQITVTGVIEENKCLEEIKQTGIQKQCFDGPYLTNIKVINE